MPVNSLTTHIKTFFRFQIPKIVRFRLKTKPLKGLSLCLRLTLHRGFAMCLQKADTEDECLMRDTKRCSGTL